MFTDDRKFPYSAAIWQKSMLTVGTCVEINLMVTGP